MKITQTESGRHVVISYICTVTGNKHGHWVDRTGKKVPSVWQENGQWIKGMSTSMDLV